MIGSDSRRVNVLNVYHVANGYVDTRQTNRPFCGEHSRPSFPHPPPVLTMVSTSQRPKGRDAVLSALNGFIRVLNLAKETCGIPPAQIAFGSTSLLLTTIRVPPPQLREDEC